MHSIGTSLPRGSAVLAAFLCLAPGVFGAEGEVYVTLSDGTRTHVHPPGKPFVVEVTVSDPKLSGERLFVRWVDSHWKPLSKKVEVVPGRSYKLESPGHDIGYYGLVFTSDDPRVAFPPQAAGFGSHHYGFAILPVKDTHDRVANSDSLFGMVHATAPFDDPYLAGGTKTLDWNTVAPRWWDERLQEVGDAGLIELPIVSGETWDQNDDYEISERALAEVARKFRDYLEARPSVREWELGIEENIRGRYEEDRYYFPNLQAKVARMRGVADELAPDVRFAINVVGFAEAEFRRLFESDAIREFDVFSSHPYRWPDFPTPEGWLIEHLAMVRGLLDESGLEDMPLWLTEFGVPVRGNNDPDGFFGYPESGAEVPGATLDYAARYLVKGHALAWSAGVERIYTYNYRNRGASIDFAEDWFGLTSYSGEAGVPGHPFPAYVAYATLVDRVEGRKLARSIQGDSGLWVFDFEDDAKADPSDTLLVWSHPGEQREVPLSKLRPGLEGREVVQVLDLYGTPRPFSGETIDLDEVPIYLVLENEVSADFSAEPRVGQRPLEVSFEDRSRGAPRQWYWQFGDGQASDQQHPSHIYTGFGRHPVSLTVSGNGRSDQRTREDYIWVHGTLKLTATPAEPKPGDRLSFTASKGLPNGRVVLRLYLRDGNHRIIRLEKGTFDADGTWTSTEQIVPPDLSGQVLTLDAVGYDVNGEASTSSPATVTFL